MNILGDSCSFRARKCLCVRALPNVDVYTCAHTWVHAKTHICAPVSIVPQGRRKMHACGFCRKDWGREDVCSPTNFHVFVRLRIDVLGKKHVRTNADMCMHAYHWLGGTVQWEEEHTVQSTRIGETFLSNFRFRGHNRGVQPGSPVIEDIYANGEQRRQTDAS